MTQKTNEKNNNNAKGIVLGLCFGVVVGIFTKNIGLWISIGLCMGVAFGNRFTKNKNES